MAYFLEHIAAHINQQYGEKLEKQCMVFPNRRAGLYFLKYLSSEIKHPVWSPAVKTINELFGYFSTLQIAENETLIFELYRTYNQIVREHNKKPESFDDFFFWGEIILNDFDDVDKYLVDAEKLYTNLSDLKKIDEKFGGLEKEQIETIREFWVNFSSGKETDEKKAFIEVWSVLPVLYANFRKNLYEKGIAYEGMIFREVAEKCISGRLDETPWESFHFTGFNALNKCERVFMNHLRRIDKAMFYWDYDISYAGDGENHSAGYFIRDNIREFGNDMPRNWNYKTYLSSPPETVSRKIIRTASDISQVKLVPHILQEFGKINAGDAHHTAIVLADENLLIPLISSIPESIEDVNITMGYPLRFSSLYSFLRMLLALQKNSRTENNEILFDYSDVASLLQHSFLSDEEKFHSNEILENLRKERKKWVPSSKLCLNADLEKIFNKPESPGDLPAWLKNILENLFITNSGEEEPAHEISLHNEFIFRTLQVINRLENIVSSAEISVSPTTMAKLFDKILRKVSVPFEGEPLAGIQIMGLLETRALDFRNLIILSVNEGTLPRSSAGSSYIPYNLREAFGLPVIRHQDSIYSYYFYRLLHRAENVVFLYNSSADGLKTGEMSRLLSQMNYLSQTPPALINSIYEIAVKHPLEQEIPRTDNHQKILENNYFGNSPGYLSPVALNTWLSCRMKFYYRYVCGIDEPEKIITTIDSAVLGTLLHETMQKIYLPYKNQQLTASDITRLLKESGKTEKLVRDTVSDKLHPVAGLNLSGSEQIAVKVLTEFAERIIRMDAQLAPFEITGLEEEVYSEMKVQINGEKQVIRLGGKIDRIDRISDKFRIMDYKTGKISMEINSLESLFDETCKERGEEWLQVLMYCEIFITRKGNDVFPAIYSLRRFSGSDIPEYLLIKTDSKSEVRKIDSYSEIREYFSSLLRYTVERIFSRNENFIMTVDNRKCSYCQYRELCKR